MKKSLFLTISILISLYTHAYDFECNGIYYNILSEEELTVEVTRCEKRTDLGERMFYSGDVVVPEYVMFSSKEYRVTTIGVDAFLLCPELESLSLPSSISTIERNAFASFPLLELELPTGLKTIQDNAFFGCYIRNIIIPEGTQTIGENAFSHSWVESISLPSSIREIGFGVFSHSFHLHDLTLPEGMKTIDKGTFYGIENLWHVTIPASISEIGSYAFGEADIKHVVNYAPVPQNIDETVFDVYGTLHVPYGCKATYEASPYWNRFTIIEDAETFSTNINRTPVITSPSPFYDLQGRRLQAAPQRGIYIENGRKVMK